MILEPLALRVRKEYKDHKAIPERKVHKVLSVQLVLKVRKDRSVLPVPKVLKVLKATLELPELRE